jgi:hypothetical protein
LPRIGGHRGGPRPSRPRHPVICWDGNGVGEDESTILVSRRIAA